MVKIIDNLKNLITKYMASAEVVYLSRAVDRTDLRARMKRIGWGDI